MCSAAAALALGSSAIPTVASAAPGAGGALPAVFATGGSGRYVDTIQWLQWGDYETQFKDQAKPNVPVLDYGETKDFVNERDLGDAGKLMTTCTLSDLKHLGHSPDLTDQQSKGPLVATIPGAWAGDALDNLYNVGGAGQWSDGSEVWHSGLTYPNDYVNKNQMAIGLANGYAYNGNGTWDGQKWGTPGSSTEPTGYASRVSVDYSCTAELHAPDGSVTPVPVAGLVFADAEASSRRYGIKSWATNEWTDEWIQASSDQNVTWRVLDTMRSEQCISKNTGKQVTTDAEVSDAGHTLRLMPSDEECVYQSGGSYSRPNGLGGPDAVMFMEGATKATVTIQGSGYSAVALGLIVATDFGDAPESYGHSGALFQPKWEGGEISSTTDVFGVQPQATMYLDQSAPRLGERIDAEGRQMFSADARGDDDNALFDDEDAIDTTKWDGGIRTSPGATHTEDLTCEGDGKLAGWIDWNNNGVFDDTEKSDEVPCTGNRATLTWKVPQDVNNTVRSVDNEPGSKSDSYMRVRMTKDNDGNDQKPTGITATGEVEDYKVSIRVPTLQLNKSVDNSYASDEVPGLSADQWTVEGRAGDVTRSGQGTTGDPLSIPQGEVSLSETSDNPEAAGYEPGQWSCQETPGTNGENYSSTVGESTDGRATLTVNNQDRVTCGITNTTKPGSLTWKKLDADGTTPVAGSEWTLSGPDVPAGTRVADCVGTCGSGAYEDQDPDPGEFSLTGLKWGTYTIEESRAPDGYASVAGTFAFTQIRGSALEGTLVPVEGVTNNGVINKRLPAVSWTKVSDTDDGPLLGGSVWTWQPVDPAGSAVEVADCAADSAADCTGEDKDPAEGKFLLNNVAAGQYTLTEKSAPAGYELDTTVRTVTVRSDEVGQTVNVGSFVNKRLVGSVSWRKADADNAAPLSGSTWTLTGPGVPAGTVVTDCGQAPCEEGAYKDQDPAAGSFKVGGLAWSDQAYALTEKDAPAGYKLDGTRHEFTISVDALDHVFGQAFENSKTTVPVLPLTGGLGADMFLIGGAVLSILAVIAAIVRRRRSQIVQ